MIHDGETIFLDASTSAWHLARCIKDKRSLTVITNSNKIVTELGSCESINVISTGGELDHRNMSFSGRTAEKNIKENYFANKFFFSCKGVTLSRGLVDSLEAEAEIKKAMMRNSEVNVFLCDRNKIGKLGVHRLASFTDVDCIITDVKPDEEWSVQLEEADVRLVIV
jgi:DeoR/GlpR family transcriptional regulator of sugar metabolism